jgi:general secretion pathway protein E
MATIDAEIGAPAVRAVDALVRRAVAAHASDVHVEPTAGGGGRIRFRTDGILLAAEPVSPELYAPLVSRLKILAGCDIANRRLPQDGRYTTIVAGRPIDARISTVPTLDGEKLAIRLFDHQADLPRLDSLGMDPGTLAAYRSVAHAPSGFIVVSGPTGSGKTTTLYASLAELDCRARNVCTVEDPIEARVAGSAQVQVNVRAGLTFPAVLRSLVRQDPDVIMIGELRDAETCAVGLSAALAGQIVFTTVHGNDAPCTIERLVELGVSRTALAAALTAVLTQRLVRVRCARCQAGTVSACAACAGTGLRGRTGVFELLLIDDALRDAIAAGASSATVARLAARAGHRSLAASAAAAVASEITTRAEIERVVGRPA